MSQTHVVLLFWQASGASEWWRLREAALLAVGAVADSLLEVQAQQQQPPLDIPALLHNVLQQDLVTPSTPPFLTGRALWMAARSPCSLSFTVTRMLLGPRDIHLAFTERVMCALFVVTHPVDGCQVSLLTFTWYKIG